MLCYCCRGGPISVMYLWAEITEFSPGAVHSVLSAPTLLTSLFISQFPIYLPFKFSFFLFLFGYFHLLNVICYFSPFRVFISGAPGLLGFKGCWLVKLWSLGFIWEFVIWVSGKVGGGGIWNWWYLGLVV